MSKKQQWLEWLNEYGPDKFLDVFLKTVENAESTCIHCGQKIYVDVLIGGGVPDWSTEDGDFGCEKSPESNEEGCGGHMPVKRTNIEDVENCSVHVGRNHVTIE